jgi:4-hydroxy-tetrahydrodipicolinate reductase
VIRVGVVGAGGRMGREVCRAVTADPGLELVAALDPGHLGEEIVPEQPTLAVTGTLDGLLDAGTEVAVDFTQPDAVLQTLRWGAAHGVHMVVGTTGISSGDLAELDELFGGSSANCLVAPNFAIGAVLAMRFAEEAARFMPAAEVIELHHDAKVDAPSGTALATARRIAAARSQAPGTAAPPHLAAEGIHPGARGADVEGVRVHSVRLPGLVAHQEVILGAQGQTLSIRHDSTDRASFMPGVLMAIKAISSLPGLTVGLEPLLGER